MQYETKKVLGPELDALATLFSNVGCRTYGGKRCYKAWQRVLNAHLDYYAHYSGRLKERKTVLSTRYAKAIASLAEHLMYSFHSTIKDKRTIPRYGIFGHYVKNNKITAKDIKAYLLKVEKEFEVLNRSLQKDSKAKSVKTPVLDVDKVVSSKVSKPASLKKGDTLQTLKPVVCLTIDGVNVSVDELYKNADFVKFVNQEAIRLRKEKHQAEADRLKLQIEKLGFNVSIS